MKTPFVSLVAMAVMATAAHAAPAKNTPVLVGEDPKPRKQCDTSATTLVVFPESEMPSDGKISEFKVFPGVIPDEKPAFFRLLVLRPKANTGTYEVVFATEQIDARSLTQDTVGSIAETTSVKKGDILAFHGRGVAFDFVSAPPNAYYPVIKFPEPGTTIELGSKEFPESPQSATASRTYSIAAELVK